MLVGRAQRGGQVTSERVLGCSGIGARVLRNQCSGAPESVLGCPESVLGCGRYACSGCSGNGARVRAEYASSDEANLDERRFREVMHREAAESGGLDR